MIKIEYSTMCLDATNYKRKIEEAKKYVEKRGFKFGVQLHNSIQKDLLDKLIELKECMEFTIHSPVLTDILLNLAVEDFDIIHKTADQAVEYLKLFNTDIFFFHGFFMTKKVIKNDMQNYRKMLVDSMPAEYKIGDSIVMNPKFLDTREFEEYKIFFKNNYKKLITLYPNFIVGIENDYPGIGSGFQRVKDIKECIDNLWFDIGHLWCSSILHEFNFYEAAYDIIESMNIIGVHLNHNLTPMSADKDKIYDSHTHLYAETEQNLKKIMINLAKKGVDLFTLEIIDGDIDDVKILTDWLS